MLLDSFPYFADTVPYRFNRWLRIHLGDIISPRCFLTESDISASLSPSNAIGIQVTLGWLTFVPIESHVAIEGHVSENHSLLKRFGTADVLGIVYSAMSLVRWIININHGSWWRRVLHAAEIHPI